MDSTITTGTAAQPLSMSARGRTALSVLGTALLLGLLGDSLLRALPWGLNAGLWLGSLVGAAAWLLHQQGGTRGDGRWLALPILAFGAALAWRDSGTLALLAVLAVLLSLLLAATTTREGQLALYGIGQLLLSGLMGAIHALAGIFLLGAAIEWRTIPRGWWDGALGAVGRGLLLTLPVLLLFGGLLVAADAIFSNLVSDLFVWNLDELIGHVILIAFWSWLTGGYLFQLLLADSVSLAAGRPAFLRLGLIEVGMVLGALNLLFLAFVLVQFRYFFGGANLIEITPGLSYAEYARRGFFELVAVVALVLPLLLGSHWLLRPQEPRSTRTFQGLAGVTVLLLVIIIASALQRMRLYTDQFGLTELRLYTTAFMGWLGLLLGWFVATVLRGQRERFVTGGLVAGFALLALLFALNPDALIVRTNAGRSEVLRPFDSRYVATQLSADAVPALLAAMPTMAREAQCEVAAQLLAEWADPYRDDWRTWNWSRYQAHRAVAEQQAALAALPCPDAQRP